MRAAVYSAFNTLLAVEQVADPMCPPDGVVVKVMACGVCRSDWHAWSGSDKRITPPHVPGHEFSGEVVEVGPEVKRWKLGDRVTAPFILSCGACPDCLAGDAVVCANQHVVGFSAWGAYAELLPVVHADFNLVRIPDELDYVAVAGMGCRVTTAFRALTDRAQLKPGEWLAVHGSGGIGLSAVMLAAAMGARVLAVDVNDEALEFARAVGASATLNVKGMDQVGERVREMTGGGAHVSIDGLGITETFHNSLASLRKLGRHIQVGMPLGRHATPTIPLLEMVYARQISILGSRGIAASRFPPLFEMIAAGRIDPGRLVTSTIPLEGAGEALAAMNTYNQVGITVIDMTKHKVH